MIGQSEFGAYLWHSSLASVRFCYAFYQPQQTVQEYWAKSTCFDFATSHTEYQLSCSYIYTYQPLEVFRAYQFSPLKIVLSLLEYANRIQNEVFQNLLVHSRMMDWNTSCASMKTICILWKNNSTLIVNMYNNGFN
jgi:hypothetical protein